MSICATPRGESLWRSNTWKKDMCFFSTLDNLPVRANQSKRIFAIQPDRKQPCLQCIASIHKPQTVANLQRAVSCLVSPRDLGCLRSKGKRNYVIINVEMTSHRKRKVKRLDFERSSPGSCVDRAVLPQDPISAGFACFAFHPTLCFSQELIEIMQR